MNEEKIKVESLDIIVTMIDGKPYYEIKYKEVGKRHYNIGYSSYNMDFVLEWREQYFEVIENKAAKDTNVPGKWIPCSERLPEDIDRRFFMCLVENHLEDPPMFCQYEEGYGFGFWKDIYDPVTLGYVDSEFETMEELGYEKVLYWMPMIEPPEESEE